MIAARQIAFGGSAKKWENPYITDGLIAMWDGEWNAGFGVHDASATLWKDLVGEFDATPINSPAFDENSSVLNGGYWEIPNTIIPVVESENLTMQAVFKSSGNNSSNQGIVGIGEGRALWLFFGDSPVNPSGSTLNFQFRSSSPVRVWKTNDGVFGTSIHSVSGVIENNLCSAYLDSIYRDGGISAGTSTSNRSCFLGNLFSYNKLYGNIYSIRLYNRALTAEEIAYNYEIDKARFNI